MTIFCRRNEEALDRFRDWLAQTEAEIDSLPVDVSDHSLETENADLLSNEVAPDSGVPQPLLNVGLLPLLEAFTALRHELKLQTKSARGLEDTVQVAVHSLDAAVQHFQSVRAREQDAVNLSAKPFVEALLECHEALLRGQRAFEVTHQQMTLAVPLRLRQTLDEQFQQLPWWRRRLARSWHEQVCTASSAALTQSSEDDFSRLLQGFGLILARLERALHEHQIRRIECTGRSVNPAEMSVVELVDAGAPPETVVEEVRPGYTWRGTVIRFAEVRAQRSPSPAEWNRKLIGDE